MELNSYRAHRKSYQEQGVWFDRDMAFAVLRPTHLHTPLLLNSNGHVSSVTTTCSRCLPDESFVEFQNHVSEKPENIFLQLLRRSNGRREYFKNVFSWVSVTPLVLGIPEKVNPSPGTPTF